MWFTVVIHHDILRLDVAMHDRIFMSVRKSGGELANNLHAATFIQRVSHLGIGQQSPVYELRRTVVAVLFLAAFKCRHDVGTFESGGCFGFGNESLDSNSTVGTRRQNFDRHVAFKLRIKRQVDSTKRPLSEHPFQFEPPERSQRLLCEIHGTR